MLFTLQRYLLKVLIPSSMTCICHRQTYFKNPAEHRAIIIIPLLQVNVGKDDYKYLEFIKIGDKIVKIPRPWDEKPHKEPEVLK